MKTLTVRLDENEARNLGSSMLEMEEKTASGAIKRMIMDYVDSLYREKDLSNELQELQDKYDHLKELYKEVMLLRG